MGLLAFYLAGVVGSASYWSWSWGRSNSLRRRSGLPVHNGRQCRAVIVLALAWPVIPILILVMAGWGFRK